MDLHPSEIIKTPLLQFAGDTSDAEDTIGMLYLPHIHGNHTKSPPNRKFGAWHHREL